jgi:Zn finger protein HypA/HybF involved in hydrogenase expression
MEAKMIECDECGTVFTPITDAYRCPECGTEKYPPDEGEDNGNRISKEESEAITEAVIQSRIERN